MEIIMIRYDKEVYNKHYGKIINIFSIIVIIGIIILSTFTILIQKFAFKECAFVVLTCLFLIAATLNARYRTVLRSKKMRIEFLNDFLYISNKYKCGFYFICDDKFNGYPGYCKELSYQDISYDYKIYPKNLNSWNKDNRFYYLNGIFESVLVINGIPYESNDVRTRIRIPRAFKGDLELERTLDAFISNSCYRF